METQTMVERGRRSSLITKQKKTNKILFVRLEGLFWAGLKWLASSSFGLWVWQVEASHYNQPSREAAGVHTHRFGLWGWPLEASHYAQPKAPIPMFYWLYLAHLFGLSTKFGHSIPHPLDLDSHSVKRP
jgi:hypothetical protein